MGIKIDGSQFTGNGSVFKMDGDTSNFDISISGSDFINNKDVFVISSEARSEIHSLFSTDASKENIDLLISNIESSGISEDERKNPKSWLSRFNLDGCLKAGTSALEFATKAVDLYTKLHG